MSGSRPPPEIVDHIIDLLQGERETLKVCCLVSRSWVPRARRYLFREAAFDSYDDFVAWEETFPDPVGSPACYTRSLSIGCASVIFYAGDNGWVQAFSNVVQLKVRDDSKPWSIPGFLKLVYSLPLLEDLDLADYAMDGDDDDYDNDDDDSTTLQPLTPPPLTGTLVLSLIQGMGPVTRRLLELPNGIHFRKLQCMWHLGEEELRWIMDVVEGCSDTLECISIYSEFNARVIWAASSIDFSNATKLKEVSFRLDEMIDVWITFALKTLTPKHRDLRQISLCIPVHVSETFTQMSEETYRQYMDLDRILVKLFESNAVHVRIVCFMGGGEEEVRERVERLFPEVTKRGIFELVDYGPLG